MILIMFTRAIVRKPCPEMIDGLSTADLGQPDFEKALEQHAAYIEALKNCGLELIVLEADNDYPDSCFVEDPALLTPSVAIITNPGAPSRQGERESLQKVIRQFYDKLEFICAPATIEAGDIMMVGSHYFIGLSERTNAEGATQMIALLEAHGMTGSVVEMSEMLHLKTGVSYLENNNLVVMGEMITKSDFGLFNKIVIDEDEAPAANCIWVNNTVLMPSRRPKAKVAIEQAGYNVVCLDVSEYEKLDGGLSCLSLRF